MSSKAEFKWITRELKIGTDLPGDGRDELVGQFVGRGQAEELVPVPGDHGGDVEPGHEGHRNFA